MTDTEHHATENADIRLAVDSDGNPSAFRAIFSIMAFAFGAFMAIGPCFGTAVASVFLPFQAAGASLLLLAVLGFTVGGSDVPVLGCFVATSAIGGIGLGGVLCRAAALGDGFVPWTVGACGVSVAAITSAWEIHRFLRGRANATHLRG